MASEWGHIRLRDICEVITKGTTPTTIGYEFSDSGINFIKSECLTYEGAIDSSKIAFISPQTHQAMSRSQIQANDILMSMAGVYLGKVALVSEEHTPANTNQAVAIIRLKPGGISHRFVAYCLRRPSLRTSIINGVAQSAQPNINLRDIGNLTVPLPPLKDQQAIACILGALDDKIELNRRMNETLQGIAQAIFKSWFVDFDPVREKMEREAAKTQGRKEENQDNSFAPLHPGALVLNPAIADLFPTEFEDSDLGEIPRGWEVHALPDILEINPSRQLSRGTLAPYLDMARMPTQGHAPDAWIEREVGSGIKFRNGDTLVARITPCLENGKTAYVDFLKDGEVGWGSTEYIVLRPRGPIPTIFAYLLARSNEFRTFAIQQMTGSSGRQRVPADSLAQYELVAPAADSPVFTTFGRAVNPLFERIRSGMEQSRALAALRDTLLPRLISGELRVPDAEKFVEAAV